MLRQQLLTFVSLIGLFGALVVTSPPKALGTDIAVNARDEQGRTPLMFAALLGNTKVLESLLADGADVNAADDGGRTTLMYAASGGYQDLVEILLKHGAGVDARDKDGTTALILAVTRGRREVVPALVEAGADISAEDAQGRSALDHARGSGDEEMLSLLGQEPVPEKSAAPPELQPSRLPPPRVLGADGRKYATISEAIRDARPGARLEVPPGVYREGLVLDKEVEIVGVGPREGVIVESTDSDCIMMQTGRAVVRGLTLRCLAEEEDGLYAVDVPRGTLLLQDCDITSRSLSCIGVHGESARATIQKCWIRDGNDAGVFVFDRGGASLEDCEIFNNLGAGVASTSGADPAVSRCRIHHGRGVGVHVHDGGRGTFEDCDIYRNAESEVLLESGGTARFANCRIARHEDPPDELLSIDTVDTNLGGEEDVVDPELSQIVLRFAQPMDTGSWFLGKSEESLGNFPELVGTPPAFYSDERTFVLNVDLDPDTRYAFLLNEEGNWAFRSARGIPLEPTTIQFRTGETPVDADDPQTAISPSAGPAPGPEEEALARVEQLGGKVKREGGSAGSPVVEIDLDLTRTSDDDLVCLEAFPRMQTLLLAGTRVTNEGMRHLGSLTELRKLDLGLTQVHGVGLIPLLSNKSLEELYAARTMFTGFDLEILSRFPRLRTLCLDSTAAGVGPGLEPLRGMGRLEVLSLDEVALDAGDLACLEDIPELKLLSVKKTAIVDADLEHLEKLGKLLFLDLSGTEITDEGLEHLEGLSKLKELRLVGTKVTDEAVRRLGAALPGTKIVTAE